MTYFGTLPNRKVSYLDPVPESFDIEDIALGLSRIPRWLGQTKQVISVAQHSLIVAGLCEQFPLAGLLHDASEAYTGDCPTNLKAMLPNFRDIENRLMEAISIRFRFPFPLPPEVKEADKVALAMEERDVRGPNYVVRNGRVVPGDRIRPMESEAAYAHFLWAFENIPATRF